MLDLVGDRFLVRPDRWLDLATGQPVVGRIVPASGGDAESGRLAEAHAAWRNGAARLIDFGVQPPGARFEVWNQRFDPRGLLYSIRHVRRAVVAAIVRCAEGHTGRGPRGLTIETTAGAGTVSVVSELARALRDLGFVVVRADLWLPRRLRRLLCHRHVVLVDTWRARRAGATAAWLADLVSVSDRAHLVLSIRAAGSSGAAALAIGPVPTADLVAAFVPGAWRPSPGTVRLAAAVSGGWPGRFREALDTLQRRARGSGLVRERAVIDAGAPPALGSAAQPPGLHLRRADALARRGRGAAASRWYRAAFHAARRRCDGGASLAAFRAAAQPWRDGITAAEVARMAAELLARLPAGEQRVEVASLAGRALVAGGALGRGEAFLGVADALVRALVAPDGRAAAARPVALATGRAELRFWQGRFALGLRELDEEVEPADELSLWRGLLAWGARDCAALARALASLPAQASTREVSVHETAWRFTLDVLAASALGRADALGRAVHAFETWCASNRHVRAGRLCWAAAASARCATSTGTGPDINRQDGPIALLVAWLRRLGAPVCDPVRRNVRRAISARGAVGIWRWGEGELPMNLIEGLPALFEIVHEGGDEAAALERACDWVKRSTRAVRAGVFAVEGAPCLGGDRDAAAGLPPEHARQVLACGRAAPHVEQGTTWVVAPVRYGGVTIGTAAARGLTSDVVSLTEGVLALASTCAPLVRARLDLARLAASADTLVGGIIGTSPAVAAVRAAAARAAAAPFPVLIEGESGTGKELVARALHRLGPRRDRRFCALNCAALTDELFESELFGHARGAFTGAVGSRLGLFEEAHQGTLFLDEVAELSLRAQAKLLRVLQDGEIRRVGENAPRAVDVRLVAATNRPLAKGVAAGAFREDLLFRLAVVRIMLPPLRERVEDIPLLAQHFWREATQRTGSRAVLAPDALAALCRHDWPGNVRQLQNALAALAVAAPPRGRVGARHLACVFDAQGAHGAGLDLALDDVRRTAERQAVVAALARHAGSRVEAARALGLTRQGLVKAMRRLGLGERTVTPPSAAAS